MASIRKLELVDDVGGFQSGHEDLDRFLHHFAKLNQFGLHTSATYVAIEGAEIVGYVTVASAEGQAVHFEKLRKKRLPRYSLPMLRMARLAVAKAWQRKGVGNQLVRHAFGLALKMTREVDCVGVIVDPKTDSVEYYRKLGFEPKEMGEGLTLDPSVLPPMFLPIQAIEQALGIIL